MQLKEAEHIQMQKNEPEQNVITIKLKKAAKKPKYLAVNSLIIKFLQFLRRFGFYEIIK